MKQADDAVLDDTTSLDLQQSAAKIREIIASKIGGTKVMLYYLALGLIRHSFYLKYNKSRGQRKPP